MFKSFISPFLIVLLWSNFAVASNAHGISSKDVSIWARAFYFADKGQFDRAASEANAASDGDILKLVQWMQYSGGSGNDYDQVMDFSKKNPGWPDPKLLRNRAEETLNSTTDPSTLIRIFKNEDPVTGRAMRLLAEAKIATNGDSAEINKLLRQAWLQGDFTSGDERDFLREHGARIRAIDSAKRIDRLLWEGRIPEAKHLMGLADNDYRRLFTTRITLMEEKRGAESSIGKVPESLRNDPGLQYEMINFYHKHKDFQKVYELMKPITGKLPYPEKWWDIKNRLVRELMEERKYKAAYSIASNHGNADGSADFAEAEWLAGWLALRFMNDPLAAYEHFYALYQNVVFPVSKSRGAYWAGRAAEANNNAEIAQKWYLLAADHPTTFYGQLGSLKLQPGANVKIPAFPTASNEDNKKFQRGALIKSAYLLTTAQQYKLAEKFLMAAIDNAGTASEMAAISQFGNKMRRPDLSVTAAKQALKKEVVLSQTGWPVLNSIPSSDVEDPLVLAITRQESSFFVAAQSPADARGLMQLLPSTAKLMAKKLNIKYNENKLLTDPSYNMKLGSNYLGGLIDNFDGSYILAIASYNAGPSNIKKWLVAYGDPRLASTPEEALDWLESIPFYETRSYVQRVLENVQVYRSLMKKKSTELDQDILRSRSRGVGN